MRDFRQDDHTLEITSIFACLVARSFALPMLRYRPLAYHASHIVKTKPLTHLVLANRCLAMLPLCSAPLIALLVAGEDWSLFRVGTWIYFVGISQYLLYLINASIYLVKGGRLGLMPGVLFHSCRPSFRHTGVMFPDFAFLTRSGDLWDPLDSSP